MAIGLTVSCTLTVAAHVAALPFTSVTANTTGLIPTFAQVKLLLFNVNDALCRMHPRAVVDLGRCDRLASCIVKICSNILANGNWSYCVLYTHCSSTSGCITIYIRNS